MRHLVEYLHEQAWKIIKEMSHISFTDEYLTIIFMQSYLDKKEIQKNIEMLGYSNNMLKFNQFKKPFFLKFLPISSPYCFILYNPNLCNIYLLANSCNSFLMFELLLLKNNKNNNRIVDKIMKNIPIFYQLDFIRSINHEYFFCGFDFDDPNFESGVSRVCEYTFVPKPLRKYFLM